MLFSCIMKNSPSSTMSRLRRFLAHSWQGPFLLRYHDPDIIGACPDQVPGGWTDTISPVKEDEVQLGRVTLGFGGWGDRVRRASEGIQGENNTPLRSLTSRAMLPLKWPFGEFHPGGE